MAKESAVLDLPAVLETLRLSETCSGDRAIQQTLVQLEREVLPEFMRERRWFGGKGSKIATARMARSTIWIDGDHSWLLALIQVQMQDGLQQQYFLPMSLAWEDQPDSGVLLSAEWALAKCRIGQRAATLVDAFADPAFCLSVTRAVGRTTVVPFGNGEIHFKPTRAFADLASRGIEPVEHLGREQSNTSVVLGQRLFLKGYRQSRPGVNPDMEVPRFLTQAGFGAIPPLAGAVEYVSPGEPPVTLAALFAFVPNQGDGWAYTLNHLERFAMSLKSAAPASAPHTSFLAQMQVLGRRVGEMHTALATATPDPNFSPELVEPADISQWRDVVIAEAHLTFELVRRRAADLPDAAQATAQEFLKQGEPLIDRIRVLANAPVQATKTRYHGDLHLGQVLLAGDDFLITDFEGEPARPIEERRRKSSPLRDVAGMLRSFDYARAVGLEHALSLHPGLADRLRQAFESWHDESREAFLHGYRTGSRAARSVPTDESAFRRLTALFEIEKALYEVRYELDNRPLWLNVPAQGRLTLATQRG